MSDAVQNLLTQKGISFTPSGKDYLIKCLNPEHEDSNPSCRVDKLTGVTHCFSCGWKRNLFRHFGILTTNTSVKTAALKQKLQELVSSNVSVEMPDGCIPYTQTYRGISASTFKHFEAFHTDRVEKLVDRIVFPIREVTGRIVAFIGRHTLSNANPRYVVYPSGRPLPLFPPVIETNGSMLMVEGIFDMLNLYDKGIRNCICTFGTSTISQDNVKNKMLPYKVQGVTKVYLMYDGDDPGREAAKALKPILESEDLEVEIIQLEDDTDPGNLSADEVSNIKEYVS